MLGIESLSGGAFSVCILDGGMVFLILPISTRNDLEKYPGTEKWLRSSTRSCKYALKGDT